jgi:hypothetical protein
MTITVSRLALTPIKGTRLQEVDAIELGPTGARGDRRFYIVDEADRMINGKRYGNLCAIDAEWSEDDRELALSFPDGTRVAGSVEHDGTAATTFFGSDREAALVGGPFSDALSAFFGAPLRLVETDSAVDRGRYGGAVSLISRGSLTRLAEIAAEDSIDSRRFRMLIEVDGIEPHAEDRWVGEEFSVGAAVLRFNGHVGRCLVTNRNPDTGKVDFPTLIMLAKYRLDLETTERLPFGVYGEVASGGRVAVGNPVERLG